MTDKYFVLSQALKTGTAPNFQLFNKFRVSGSLTTHNIDGAGTKIKLNTMRVVVRDTSITGNVIGCTAALLA